MEETQQSGQVVDSSGSSSAAAKGLMGAGIVDEAGMAPEHQAGSEHAAPKGYLPFFEARKFAVSLNLKTRKEWRCYVKGELPHMPPKPANVPAHPDGIYKVKGWQGWRFWLGTAEVGLPGQNGQPAPVQ